MLKILIVEDEDIIRKGLVFIAVYVAIDNQRKYKARIERKLKEGYGKASKKKYSEDEYETISHYFEECSEDMDGIIDDITWNDLDLETIFMIINNTCSGIGEEYLYAMLHQPQFDAEEMMERERLISFFLKNEEKRINLQEALYQIGKQRNLP